MRTLAATRQRLNPLHSVGEISVWIGLLLVAVLSPALLFAGAVVLCPGSNGVPAPRLRCTGTKVTSLPGTTQTRYFLEIENWEEYPPQLFLASPGLPPCGQNTEASRTWVRIKDQDGQQLAAFCAFGFPEDLTHLSFVVREPQQTKPDSVFVELEDRLCEITYISGRLSLDSCYPPSRHVNRSVEEVRVRPQPEGVESRLKIVWAIATGSTTKPLDDLVRMDTAIEVSVNGDVVETRHHEIGYETHSLETLQGVGKGRWGEILCNGGKCDGWSGDGPAYSELLNIGSDDDPEYLCTCKKEIVFPDVPLGVELKDGDLVRVRVYARSEVVIPDTVDHDDNTFELVYSGPPVIGHGQFRRADADGDSDVTVGDAIFVLAYSFLGGTEPSCHDAADADDSGSIELNDAVVILAYKFLGGEPPMAPGSNVCGPDPTEDELPPCAYAGLCLIVF